MKRTATARGKSGRIDRDDSVMVEIRGGYGIRRFGLSAEQALDLRQRGQRTVFRPRLHLFGRELQQSGQVLVAGNTQTSAQRALAHATVNQVANGCAFRRTALEEPARMQLQQRKGTSSSWRL